jgi:aminopeptidase
LTDLRTIRLADTLVNYSLDTRPNDWTVIFGEMGALPLVREVYRSVVESGGRPQVVMTDERLTKTLLTFGTDEQIQWQSPTDMELFERADALIYLSGSENTRALTQADPVRQTLRQAARRPMLETYLSRSAAGDLRWVITRFPTQANAQEAEMSLTEYEDFVYAGCRVDLPDPVASWRELSARQQQIVDWLKGRQEMKVEGPNCDLRFSVAGRPWINSDGHYNMPDGEVFTSPVEDSAEGWIRFSYPLVYQGRQVDGVELTLSGGRVTHASAAKEEAFLLSQLGVDEGARVVGEFAIGNNPGITQHTGDALFDEKIGGTIHMAVGHGLEFAGGVNKSAIHWDMVTAMGPGSRIQADGEIFYESGEFVI